MESLSNRIKDHLKGKDSVKISDLVVYFGESADKIIKAIKLLKDKGYIEEVN